MRIDQIVPEVVELAPTVLQPGRLYISTRYRAAVHLCCCGCGEKVVTPFSQAEWQIELGEGRVSLYPSIGNWSMPCQSHYWIRENRIVWGAKISNAKIKTVFERDQRDLKTLHRVTNASNKVPQNSPGDNASQQPNINWSVPIKTLWRWLTQ